MWPKFYKDYPQDTFLKKERIEPGKGLKGGCEMHELNGWGLSFREPPQVAPRNYNDNHDEEAWHPRETTPGN